MQHFRIICKQKIGPAARRTTIDAPRRFLPGAEAELPPVAVSRGKFHRHDRTLRPAVPDMNYFLGRGMSSI